MGFLRPTDLVSLKPTSFEIHEECRFYYHSGLEDMICILNVNKALKKSRIIIRYFHPIK